MIRSAYVTGLLLIISCLLLQGFIRPAAAGESSETGGAEQESGRPYRFVFHGNGRLSDRELRQAAALELDNYGCCGRQRSAVDDAAFLMKVAYLRAGFPKVRVEYTLQEEGGADVVVFTVSEGPQIFIDSIALDGCRAFPAVELLRYLSGFTDGGGAAGKGMIFVESDLHDLVDRIKAHYFSRGYLEIAVSAPEIDFHGGNGKASVVIRLQEGTRFLLTSVDFDGEIIDGLRDELATVAGELRGQPYYPRRRLALQGRIFELYAERGYPDAAVEITVSKDDAAGSVSLHAEIRSGPQVFVGPVLLTGNTRTDRDFILSRLRLAPGDLFRIGQKMESFSRLYQTGLFSRVAIDLDEGDRGAASRALHVAVEEKPAREFYLEPGWGSYELLRLKAGYRDWNLFGRGRILRADSTVSFMSKGVEAGLTDPWFLGRDLVAGVPFYYRYREEPAFVAEEAGSSFLLSKKFSRHSVLSSGYFYKRKNITSVDLLNEAQDEAADYTLATVNLQAAVDTRDDLFFPARGYRLHGMIEIADAFWGSNMEFVRVTGGARGFFPVSESVTIGLRYATGFILPAGKQDGITIGERFFNGGENTVRSYRESELGPKDATGEPFGGTAFNIFSVELRKKILQNLSGTVFADAGNIAPNRFAAGRSTPFPADREELVAATFRQYFRDLGIGVGTGLQYLLPIGPARLDLAWNPARNSHEENAVLLHFSIGMAF